MAVSNIFIDELFYEKERVGELMANAVYLPLAQNEHQADLHLFHDEREIISMNALYTAGDEEQIQGDLTFYHLPLAMADPFIPEDMAKLQGDLDGSLAISGNSQAPVLDGFLALDSVSVYVGAVGSTFRFDNKNVEIKSNKLTFDNYGIYSSGKNPFIIDGTIDFNQMDNPMANLRLTANNLELLNTKKKPESLVYGKLYVNLNSTLTGPLNLLKMRGDLQLLGGTNITYILKDSPLTVQDRLAEHYLYIKGLAPDRAGSPGGYGDLHLFRRYALPRDYPQAALTFRRHGYAYDHPYRPGGAGECRPERGSIQPHQPDRWRRPLLPVHTARRHDPERAIHLVGRNHQIRHAGYPA